MLILKKLVRDNFSPMFYSEAEDVSDAAAGVAAGAGSGSGSGSGVGDSGAGDV